MWCITHCLNKAVAFQVPFYGYYAAVIGMPVTILDIINLNGTVSNVDSLAWLQ